MATQDPHRRSSGGLGCRGMFSSSHRPCGGSPHPGTDYPWVGIAAWPTSDNLGTSEGSTAPERLAGWVWVCTDSPTLPSVCAIPIPPFHGCRSRRNSQINILHAKLLSESVARKTQPSTPHPKVPSIFFQGQRPRPLLSGSCAAHRDHFTYFMSSRATPGHWLFTNYVKSKASAVSHICEWPQQPAPAHGGSSPGVLMALLTMNT